LQHVFDKAALHRIVINNKDAHGNPQLISQVAFVPFRGTLGAGV
jgi:hypothetical protein